VTPPAARFIWRFAGPRSRIAFAACQFQKLRTGAADPKGLRFGTPYRRNYTLRCDPGSDLSELDVSNGGFALACATRRMTAAAADASSLIRLEGRLHCTSANNLAGDLQRIGR
jgi:hypothetical protein